MAWRRPGETPLPEPMMFSLSTHIYASRSLNKLSALWIAVIMYIPQKLDYINLI